MTICDTHSKCLEAGEDTHDPWWSVRANRVLVHDKQTYVPESNDLHLQVLKSKHNHQLVGYLGQSKTYQLVCWDYSWPNMQGFIEDYMKTCNTCMHNKSKCHKPYGLLKQLPVPPWPWESISMDFIEELPESQGFTEILVVVDQLTKQAMFIPA